MFCSPPICLSPCLNFPEKSNSYINQTSAIEDKATSAGPSSHNNKGKVMHRSRLPIKANMNPRSNTICVCSGDENSGAAFIKKLASIRYPMDIELHKKLSNKRSDAEPNFTANIPPDCKPKIGLSKRWLVSLALQELLIRAASATLRRIVIEAVNEVAITVFLKLCTASIPFLLSPCIAKHVLAKK